MNGIYIFYGTGKKDKRINIVDNVFQLKYLEDRSNKLQVGEY